jgi:hypothetical protein
MAAIHAPRIWEERASNVPGSTANFLRKSRKALIDPAPLLGPF